jgi:outer membrane protein assembly factor BamB
VGDAVVRIKDTDVEAFDLNSGEERWAFETTEMVPTDTSWGEPVVEDDLLYFTDYNGTLYEVGSEANGLQRLCHSEDDNRRSFAVDAEHVYIASLEPSADIPAYRKAQEAGSEQTHSERSADSPLILQALLR